MNTLTPKQKLADILLDINVAKIANRYFGKSSSWLYHKLDGIDGNGGKGDFTEEELQQLKSALLDLARRIEIAAKTL
ncbi:MAG: DUF5053 domain-containing protein [Paludibacteraceae bacterium]|nr:DUF5053 domain-containing protein [Paludibacteraceae bacterium]